MKSPSVAVVVLNWNQRDLTLACLDSLALVDYPADRLQILVVDNGSSDRSVEAVQQRYPSGRVLENGANLGYAGGNNAGVRYALAQEVDYVCILNNDVTVHAGLLTALLTAFVEGEEVGVATPLVASMADPEEVWALGSAVDWTTGTVRRLHAGEAVRSLRERAPLEVDAASGAAMLIRREVFERVGFFDDDFYLYYEETDWCVRARRAGFRILAVPSAVVWHKVSASLDPASPVVDYYMVRNQLRFIRQHTLGLTRLWLLARTIVRDLLAVAAYTVKPQAGRRLPHRNARLRALRDACIGRWGRMAAAAEGPFPGRRP